MEDMEIKNPYSRKIKYGMIKCHLKKEELHFLHLGDTGGEEFETPEGKTDYRPTLAQWIVAMNMRALVADEQHAAAKAAAAASEHHSHQQVPLPFQPDFAINSGDNFYDHGLNDDDQFEKVFLNVFNRPVENLEAGTNPKNSLAIPWYTIVGNNDWKMLDEEKEEIERKYNNRKQYNEIFLGNRRKAAKQIQYKHKKHEEESSIWKMPSEYYVVEYNFGKNKNHSKKAVFIMLQTVLLCGPSRKDFTEKPSDLKERERKVHMEWLVAVLEKYHKEDKKPDFLFIVGHYPLYLTEGERAFPHTEELHNLFQRYQITAYLAGHEHGLKHVEIFKAADPKENYLPAAHKLHILVSGAVAEMEECLYKKHISNMGNHVKICYPTGIPDTVKSVKDGGAFITVRLKATMAEFDFWAAGGQIYSYRNSAQIDKLSAAAESELLPANFNEQELLYYLPKDLKIDGLHRKKIDTLNIAAWGLNPDSSSSHGPSTMAGPSAMPKGN